MWVKSNSTFITLALMERRIKLVMIFIFNLITDMVHILSLKLITIKIANLVSDTAIARLKLIPLMIISS